MSEYQYVEKPFLDQLAALGWDVVDQGHERNNASIVLWSATIARRSDAVLMSCRTRSFRGAW